MKLSIPIDDDEFHKYSLNKFCCKIHSQEPAMYQVWHKHMTLMKKGKPNFRPQLLAGNPMKFNPTQPQKSTNQFSKPQEKTSSPRPQRCPPPHPCTHCQGNHWDWDCPNFIKKETYEVNISEMEEANDFPLDDSMDTLDGTLDSDDNMQDISHQANDTESKN